MTGKLTPKKMMHIFCEGSKTEPYYIRAYIDMYASNKAKIIQIPPTKKNTPVQLVDEAVLLKKSKATSIDDEFWVVYDREAVSKYPDSLHARARNKAVANNIKIAFSNICFELWILQHFELDCAPYSSCSDLLKRSALKEHLRRVGVNEYEKGNYSLYQKIYKGISRARVRAEELNKRSIQSSFEGRDKPHQLNSYTDIHKLLDAIDKFTP